jgi:DNA segregation ATPase FtsK/SpoIIIE-like protein
MLSGAENNTPQQFRIVIIDIGGKRYDAYKALPHCQRYITDLGEALAYLKSVEKALNGPEGKWTYRTMIVIDEIQKMTRTDDKLEVAEFQRVLKQITGLARAYGYNLIAATQKPMATILPSEMRDNFPARIAGSCASASQSSMILGPKEDAAANIRGKGTFIVRFEDNVTINSLFIGTAGSDDEIAAVREIADNSGPLPIDDRRPTVDDDGIMDEFETIDIPADLLAVFQEYDYGNGALRYGWKTKAMQAVATAKGISFKGDNRKVLEQELGKYVELYKSGEF